MQIQENVEARKEDASAWVRGIGFRTEHAVVSCALRIRAGRKVLLKPQFLLSMQAELDDCAGQAIQPAQPQQLPELMQGDGAAQGIETPADDGVIQQ